MSPHRLDHRLQIIPVLAGHAHLLILNLRRHLQLRFADEGRDFLGDGRLDSLLDLDNLPRVAER